MTTHNYTTSRADIQLSLYDESIPVYKGRKNIIYSQVVVPKPQKDNFKGYIYIVKFFNGKQWIHKVGYTNNIIRRLCQECKAYNSRECEIIWLSPAWRESTARRIEFELIEEIKKTNWELIPKERFVLPKNEKLSFDLKVRKVYEIREK